MTIVIDPDRVEDAADAFALEVAPALDDAVFRLANDLSDEGSMAGADAAGQVWSSSYDHAVKTVMGVAADVTNGSYRLAGLLEMTWGNHARADAEAYARGELGADYPHPVNYGDDCVLEYSVPSAAGGTNAEPTGWSLVRYAVGYVWPGGHQDKLRTAATAWGRAATSVSNASSLIPPAISALQEQQSPEIANAVTVSRAIQNHVCDLSNAYTNLQNACNAYAGFIDKAHADAGHELKGLVEWTIGIEAAGAIAGFFTAGIAEAPAQGVEAGRIAATAARVAEIIRALVTAARGVCETITTAIARVVEISRELKPLLGARASKAAAEAAAKLPQAAKSAEELAETGLTDSAGKLEAALDYARMPKHMEHVFEKAEHDLDGLVTAVGNRSATMERIIRSVGDVPEGVYGRGAEVVRHIDGYTVYIRGRMMDGVFKISTAYVL